MIVGMRDKVGFIDGFWGNCLVLLNTSGEVEKIEGMIITAARGKKLAAP